MSRNCACLGMLLLFLMTLSAPAAAPKRVLLIHSFGRDFAPYNAFSGVLRTELVSHLSGAVDIREVSLDSEVVADAAQEAPLVDYLAALAAGRALDLVIPIGGPAVRFAQRHRQVLFPRTPLLIAGTDERHIRPVTLTSNDAVVAGRIDLSRVMQTILQVLPQTTNVAVVVGASPLDTFWLNEIRAEYQRFTNRVSILCLNELSFEEMLKRCAALPPRSAIFYALLIVDAEGVPQWEEGALTRLHDVANAPLFGVFGTQLGRGAVGGPLVDMRQMGRNTAEAATRILRGEAPASIRLPPQEMGAPEFDWRELRRWGISEARLPAGSVVRFRQPGVWQHYWGLIGGGILFALAQAALIVGLLVNRDKRRQGEAMATLVADLSSRFINLPAAEVDREIEAAQRRVCGSIGLDLSALWQWTEGPHRYFKMTHLYRPLGGPPIAERFDAQEVFPWCLQQLLKGEIIPVPSMQALPPEADRDRESWVHFGIQSSLTFPLLIEGGQLIGGLSFNTVRRARSWPKELVTRLELVAQIFAHALVRKRADQELRESEARLSLAAEAAAAGLWRLDLATNAFWLTNQTRELFAFGADELVTFDRFLSLVHPEDRQLVRQKVQRVLESRGEVQVEYRILQPEGRVQWRHSRGRVQCEASGQPNCLMGVTIDVTPRKQAEEALRETQTTLRAIIDSTNDLVWSVDSTAFGLMTFNQGLSDYFLRGVGLVVAAGMRPEDLFPPGAYVQRWRDFYQRALDSGPFTAEYLTYTHHVLLQLSFNLLKRDDKVFGISVFGKDITQLKRTQSALEKSLERFRRVVEHIQDALMVDDISGRVVFANDRFLELFGVRREELATLTLEDYVAPEFRAELRERHERRVRGEQEPANFEYLGMRRDGRRLWLEVAVVAVMDEHGRITGTQSAIRDIDARKRAERELTQKEERFRQVVELAQEFIWEVDAEGLYTYASPSVTKILEYAPEELVGKKHFFDLFEPSVREELKATAFQAFGGRQTFRNLPNPNVTRSGKIVHLETSGLPLLDPQGKLLGYRGADIDVTERRRVEARVRESEARLASAVEVAGLGFYEMGSDPEQIFVDERLRSLLGLTPADHHRVQEFWMEHIHPDDRERVQEVSRKVLGGELPWATVEYRYQHPERGTLWFSHVSRAQEQDPTGKVVRRLGVIRDVTAQRQAELESQRLRGNLAHLTRVDTLGALSGSLAHELNQPLGIILSNAQAAQELLTQEQPDTAEVQAILVDIVKADRRAGEIIHRLRALFKGGPVSLESLSLNAVIEEVLHLLHAELLGRGVAVVRDLAPDLPPVAGDRVQLQQLVLNLVLNAAEAMAANAPGTRHLHLQTKRHQHQARASVRDEGEGLPNDVEPLFQPLYTTKPKGLGMGLTICRSIVGTHNGRLWAEPHPERGAVFHFELPLAESLPGFGVQGSELRAQEKPAESRPNVPPGHPEP